MAFDIIFKLIYTSMYVPSTRVALRAESGVLHALKAGTALLRGTASGSGGDASAAAGAPISRRARSATALAAEDSGEDSDRSRDCSSDGGGAGLPQDSEEAMAAAAAAAGTRPTLAAVVAKYERGGVRLHVSEADDAASEALSGLSDEDSERQNDFDYDLNDPFVDDSDLKAELETDARVAAARRRIRLHSGGYGGAATTAATSASDAEASCDSGSDASDLFAGFGVAWQPGEVEADIGDIETDTEDEARMASRHGLATPAECLCGEEDDVASGTGAAAGSGAASSQRRQREEAHELAEDEPRSSAAAAAAAAAAACLLPGALWPWGPAVPAAMWPSVAESGMWPAGYAMGRDSWRDSRRRRHHSRGRVGSDSEASTSSYSDEHSGRHRMRRRHRRRRDDDSDNASASPPRDARRSSRPEPASPSSPPSRRPRAAGGRVSELNASPAFSTARASVGADALRKRVASAPAAARRAGAQNPDDESTAEEDAMAPLSTAAAAASAPAPAAASHSAAAGTDSDAAGSSVDDGIGGGGGVGAAGARSRSAGSAATKAGVSAAAAKADAERREREKRKKEKGRAEEDEHSKKEFMDENRDRPYAEPAAVKAAWVAYDDAVRRRKTLLQELHAARELAVTSASSAVPNVAVVHDSAASSPLSPQPLPASASAGPSTLLPSPAPAARALLPWLAPSPPPMIMPGLPLLHPRAQPGFLPALASFPYELDPLLGELDIAVRAANMRTGGTKQPANKSTAASKQPASDAIGGGTAAAGAAAGGAVGGAVSAQEGNADTSTQTAPAHISAAAASSSTTGATGAAASASISAAGAAAALMAVRPGGFIARLMRRSFMPGRKESVIGHLKRASALVARDAASAALSRALAALRDDIVLPALARSPDMQAASLVAARRAELTALRLAASRQRKREAERVRAAMAAAAAAAVATAGGDEDFDDAAARGEPMATVVISSGDEAADGNGARSRANAPSSGALPTQEPVLASTPMPAAPSPAPRLSAADEALFEARADSSARAQLLARGWFLFRPAAVAALFALVRGPGRDFVLAEQEYRRMARYSLQGEAMGLTAEVAEELLRLKPVAEDEPALRALVYARAAREAWPPEPPRAANEPPCITAAGIEHVISDYVRKNLRAVAAAVSASATAAGEAPMTSGEAEAAATAGSPAVANAARKPPLRGFAAMDALPMPDTAALLQEEARLVASEAAFAATAVSGVHPTTGSDARAGKKRRRPDATRTGQRFTTENCESGFDAFPLPVEKWTMSMFTPLPATTDASVRATSAPAAAVTASAGTATKAAVVSAAAATAAAATASAAITSAAAAAAPRTVPSSPARSVGGRGVHQKLPSDDDEVNLAGGWAATYGRSPTQQASAAPARSAAPMAPHLPPPPPPAAAPGPEPSAAAAALPSAPNSAARGDSPVDLLSFFT